MIMNDAKSVKLVAKSLVIANSSSCP